MIAAHNPTKKALPAATLRISRSSAIASARTNIQGRNPLSTLCLQSILVNRKAYTSRQIEQQDFCTCICADFE